MVVIDLSHTIEEQMTVYPGSPRPKILRIATHNTNGYEEMHLRMTTHTGTHVDAPFHILPDGAKLLDLPLEKFFGNGICLKPKNEKFDIELFENMDFKQIDFVLLCTGWYKYWKTERYFEHYPLLTVTAAEFLAKQGIKGVGVDAISIDAPDAEEFLIHRILLEKNKIIIENLTNLDLICGKKFKFAAFPLKISGAEGAPVRAVAIFD